VSSDIKGGAGLRVVWRAFIAVAAWLVPGLGHLMQKRWGRGLVLLAGVGALAVTGALLRGVLFKVHGADLRGDPLTFLGSIGDAGSGVFYWIVRALEKAGPDVSRATGDYGTRFIAAAGVANYLCVADALEIAMGRKE
jgi:hypothetical protein